jgi:exodeoxyribonuclease X
MHIHVIDTETTGLDPEKDAVVEFAAVKIVEAKALGAGGDQTFWHVKARWSSFVDPRRPIPPEASAVHHIIDADVADAPALGNAVANVFGPDWPDEIDILAAHNCRFDLGFLPMLKDKRWIDTYRCALHIWPDAPSHSNQALRYWLKIDLPRDGAHRALADATVTAHVLVAILRERTVDDLIKLSTKAVVLRKVGFGKHFGSLWTEVPHDYLSWAAKQDFDPDVRFTIKSEIARRSKEF